MSPTIKLGANTFLTTWEIKINWAGFNLKRAHSEMKKTVVQTGNYNLFYYL
jgi:hypothetical protein